MKSLYFGLTAIYLCISIFLMVRFGYLAATEAEGPRKIRGKLIATLAFVSLFIVLPLLWIADESTLPIFEFDGVIRTVQIFNSDNRHFSAQLTITTNTGGTISVHVSDRGNGWQEGQRLHIRYLGDSGELLQATFFDAEGHKQGVANRTAGPGRALSILFGALLCGATIRRYRRDIRCDEKSTRFREEAEETKAI
jgi:hypothetical protein